MVIKESISIIKWIEQSILWVSVNSFLQPSLSLANGLRNKMAMMSGMEVMHAFSIMDFYSLKPTWIQSPVSVQSVSRRSQHWVLDIGTIPWGGHLATSWQVDHICQLLSRNRQSLIPIKIDAYSGYKFAFLAGYASAKTLICGPSKCLIHHPDILHSVASE